MARCWMVICPEPHVLGGVWSKWWRERCVAIGWGPPAYSLEGPTDTDGWALARKRLKEMKPGDKVIPFLLKHRIGPAGTIRSLRIHDDEWAPTVEQGQYALNPAAPDLGRRVEVDWDTDGMPGEGQVAVVPVSKRGKAALALQTVTEISEQRFRELVDVLRDKQTWADLAPSAPAVSVDIIAVAQQEQALSVLERDLQKFLARNLGLLEPGLKASPDHPLEELIADEVGRLDLFCVDSAGGYVVVELKAGTASDDAIGQIAGYMSWVRDNIAAEKPVRGFIVCRDASARVQAAVKLIPELRLKRYRMSFSLEEIN